MFNLWFRYPHITFIKVFLLWCFTVISNFWFFCSFSIDNLKIPSACGKGYLRRVSEVFDCWFESGSMPYAQAHYPFENVEEFNENFPADFIAEGVDQTRGWYAKISYIIFIFILIYTIYFLFMENIWVSFNLLLQSSWTKNK